MCQLLPTSSSATMLIRLFGLGVGVMSQQCTAGTNKGPSTTSTYHNLGMERELSELQIEENDLTHNSGGLQSLVLGTLVECGSIFLAFLTFGCVALIIFYIVNWIYVFSYILIQLLVGDGKSTLKDNQNLIRDLIVDQILLYRLWGNRGTSSSSRPAEPNSIIKNKFVLRRDDRLCSSSSGYHYSKLR